MTKTLIGIPCLMEIAIFLSYSAKKAASINDLLKGDRRDIAKKKETLNQQQSN